MSYTSEGEYIYEVEYRIKYGEGSKWAEKIYWLEMEIGALEHEIGLNPETGEWDSDKETQDRGRLAQLEAKHYLMIKERNEAEERLL